MVEILGRISLGPMRFNVCGRHVEPSIDRKLTMKDPLPTCPPSIGKWETGVQWIWRLDGVQHQWLAVIDMACIKIGCRTEPDCRRLRPSRRPAWVGRFCESGPLLQPMKGETSSSIGE